MVIFITSGRNSTENFHHNYVYDNHPPNFTNKTGLVVAGNTSPPTCLTIPWELDGEFH